MIEERDIVRISIPFSIGVAVAMYFTLPYHIATYITTGLSATGIIALSMVYCSNGERQGICFILFFLCGVFCALCSKLSPTITHNGEATAKAFLSVSGLIDNIGFPHNETTALVKALLTGNRSELSKSTIEAFRQAGGAHILALSGLHIGVIYTFFSRLLSIAGRRRIAYTLRAFTIVGAGGFFVQMTGSSPSVVRAFLFMLINELSHLLPGRRRRPIAVLCGALMIQLLFDPVQITSIGFQLSYLAMLGIYTLFPHIRAWYPDTGKKDPVRHIWETAALTISCQLYTAPLAWLYFRSFPLFFLISNITALPLTEILMVLSIICLLLCGMFGECPGILKSLTDTTGEALISVMKIVSSL